VRFGIIVSDIDGCLNRDEWSYDFDQLSRLRELNIASMDDPSIPPLTLCSGRQAAYVDMMSRLVGSHLPAIFEGGCGVFFPDRRTWPRHLLISDVSGLALSPVLRAIKRVTKSVADETGAVFAVGKEVLQTLHPVGAMTTEELGRVLVKRLRDAGIDCEIRTSGSAVDVSPSGIDKGSGLLWLLETLDGSDGLSIDRTVAIGDSPADLPMLARAGMSAAPANAAPEVLEAVDFVSKLPYAAGVLDIVERCIGVNRGRNHTLREGTL
jgi:HAD superfamily hydrolase (TIGR01484 family)